MMQMFSTQKSFKTNILMVLYETEHLAETISAL